MSRFSRLRHLAVFLIAAAPTPLWAQLTEVEPDSVASVESRDVFDVISKLLHGERIEPALEGGDVSTGLAWVVLPSFSYNPVYGFAIGGSASGAGRIDGRPTSRISMLSLGANYSTTEQIQVQARGDLYLNQNEFLLKADCRYLDTSRPTFGLGPVTPGQEEYPMDYKLVRTYVTGLWSVGGPAYAGIGYHLDAFADIVDERAQNGELTPYVVYTGSPASSALSSGLSMNLLGDGRDNPVNPRQGFYISSSFRTYLKELGSDENWQEMLAEFRTYPRLPVSSRNRLCFWLQTWFTFGHAPYLNLPNIGGDTYGRSGRGYIQGRIRSADMIYAEAEYRLELMKDGLLGAVGFLNMTWTTLLGDEVFGKANDGGGVGLRMKFSKRSDTNLTIDAGWGEEDSFGCFIGTTEIF